jgi:hypothetical protein
MIDENDFFVAVKLGSGEHVLAVLVDEDVDTVHLRYPMVIKVSPQILEGRAVEHMTAAPLCPFSGDPNYFIERHHLMYVKEMHQAMVEKYVHLIETTEQEVEVHENAEGDLEEKEMPMSLDELRDKLNRLSSMVGLPPLDKLEKEDLDKFFIEGNDTVN